MDLRAAAFLLCCAGPAAADEPVSLTLDCQISARAAYTTICADPVLREIAAEERRIDEARTARGASAEHRFSQSLARQSHMFARDYCLNQVSPTDCLTAVLLDGVMEHWMTEQSPAQRGDGTFPPDEIHCGERVLYGLSVGTDTEALMIGTGDIRSIVTLTVVEDVAKFLGEGIHLTIDTAHGTVTLIEPLPLGATCEIVRQN